MEEIEKIWASGQPLFDFWKELFDAEMEKVQVPLQPTKTRQILVDELYERNAKVRAFELMQVALGSRAAVGIGYVIPPEGKSDCVEVPAAAWGDDHADIQQFKNAISSNGEHFTKIRVLKLQHPREPSEGNPAVVSERCTKGKKGRPSNADLILTTIASFAVTEPHWWKNGKMARRKAYYERIRKKHGFDPKAADGFAAKTIEKYETKYRSNTAH